MEVERDPRVKVVMQTRPTSTKEANCDAVTVGRDRPTGYVRVGSERARGDSPTGSVVIKLFPKETIGDECDQEV